MKKQFLAATLFFASTAVFAQTTPEQNKENAIAF